MNFFKSILSEDPDPHPMEHPDKSTPKSPTNNPTEENEERASSSPSNSAADHGGSGWSIGGLIKTLATQSESVIEIYRRDLREFGSGLQKETATFREVASRAVKDLPASIEVGASAIDGVLKSTAEIISHGKGTLLAPSDGESDSDALSSSYPSLRSRRYSRFDVQLLAIQSDSNTYCEELEDLEAYNKWKLGFVLEDSREELNRLVEENEAIEGIYKRVVPNVVDDETFWCRYFYRVHKLKQQEDVRANLVRRAISVDMDEELSWDVDDEDDNKETGEPLKGSGVTTEKKESGSEDLPEVVNEENKANELRVDNSEFVDEKGENKPQIDKWIDTELSSEKVKNQEESSEVKIAEADSKSDEKVDSDGKADNGESCKGSDVSILSTQPSLPEEEDLGWDEIEDLGGNDEKKVILSGSPNRADLRKRRSAADEDEDLSWDIEDDDEPITKPATK